MEDNSQYLTKPVEIIVPPCGNKSLKVIDAMPDVLLLHEKYLEIKYKAKVEETKDGIPTTTNFKGNICYMKNKISAVRCFYVESEESFEMNIHVDEDKLCYALLFKTFSEALKVKEQILQWLIQ